MNINIYKIVILSPDGAKVAGVKGATVVNALVNARKDTDFEALTRNADTLVITKTGEQELSPILTPHGQGS